ncbi:MAG: protein kinase [Planctomycetes bacterium]|nr:protein kinase [Planctomycetota bacterium]MCW8134364.1 protein kinase [Planctomycetota bacterium]
MNDLPSDDSRRKAVLAAVLAVQRGLVSPDEAVSVIAQLGGGAQQSLLSIAPGNVAAEIADEAEKLAADPEAAGSVLAEMGLAPESQSTLFTFNPESESDAATRVLRTMLETARTTGLPDQVKAVSARLPKVGGSGRYTVKREYARGGMGRILIALDNAVGREVALKELLPQPGAGSSGTSSAGLVERFLREAKVTGQLEHPNIVPVYEIAARDDGSVFYTMKLVRGKTMAHRLQAIQRDALSDQEKLAQRLKLLDAFTDVCNAIAYAHSRGVIHRDLKPANIMLGDFGETLVLDWGLARVQGQEEKAPQRKGLAEFSPSLLQDDSSARTLDGAVLGTPAYMPPEQAKGELDKVDEKSDVYALGAILYEILSGHPPFEGTNAQTVLARVLVTEPEPLKQIAPNAPPDLVSLADKAMARDRAQRLESAQALAREVIAFRDGRTLSVYRYSRGELLRRFVRRNRAPVAVAAIALLLMLGGAAYAFTNIMSERDTAQGALAAADAERQARQAVEQRQQRDRERLIEQRQAEIGAQQGAVQDSRGGNLTDEARRRIRELQQRGVAQGGMSPADRAENARIVSGLLASAGATEELLRLMTEPVAGVSHEFVPDADLVQRRNSLRESRYLAAELATLNEDFALAAFIVEGTLDATDEKARRTQAVESARSAVLVRHKLAIEAALDDVRQGLARPGRPRGFVRLDDYVLQLSAYRELQTIELLVAALAPFIEKARDKDPDLLWTQPERDEVTLLCRVLGYLELPERAVPPLAEFLSEISDTRLAIEAGTALCQTAHEAAYQPLVAARARFGVRSYVWSQVMRNFNRVPEPQGAAEPATAAQYLERASIRVDQGLTLPARADREKAYELEPRNPRAIAAKATTLGNTAAALELYDLAISLEPTYARAWSNRGHAKMNMRRFEEAYSDMTIALALDPRDDGLWQSRGYLNNVWLRDPESGAEDYTRMLELAPHSAVAYANRASAYFELGKPELAIGDATRALELNPYHPEAWNNRAAARSQLGDINGAIEDLTRMLEVSPGHAWAHINRAANRMRLKQYKGALYDLNQTIARALSWLPQALRMRAECHEALGDKPAALEDYKEYLKRAPNAQDAEDVNAAIARLEGE